MGHKPDQENIDKVEKYLEENRKYKGMIFYARSLPGQTRTTVSTAPYVLEQKVASGEMEKVKQPRYRGDVLTEYTVLANEEFPSDMQDPEDYMEISKHDVEEVIGYRFVPTIEVQVLEYPPFEMAFIRIDDKIAFTGNYHDFHPGCSGTKLAGYELGDKWNHRGMLALAFLTAIQKAGKKATLMPKRKLSKKEYDLAYRGKLE